MAVNPAAAKTKPITNDVITAMNGANKPNHEMILNAAYPISPDTTTTNKITANATKNVFATFII